MTYDTVIHFENIVKSYDGNKILDNFNLTVNKGDFLTVIGSSGCGKTTLLKLINGLLTPDSGTIYINGEDISKIDLIKLRRNIGYVIQEVGLFPHMNIKRNISYVPSLSKKGDNKQIIENAKDLMKVVGLNEDLLNRYPSELSGGQRQRVGIARALAAKPDILLMDEPFGSVDEITRKLLQEAISNIHKSLNITIVFITHDIKEALSLGTNVVVMDKGNLHQYASPKEIVESPKTDFVKQLVLG